MTREKFEQWLLREAASWVGVPFLHNGRSRSQGVDCLGLVVCVYRGIGLDLPDGDGRAYTHDWWLHTPEARYLDGVLAHGVPVAKEALQVGDILLFRPGILDPKLNTSAITHGGLYLGGGRFLHSITGRAVEAVELARRAWTVSYAGAIRLGLVLEALGESCPVVALAQAT